MRRTGIAVVVAVAGMTLSGCGDDSEDAVRRADPTPSATPSVTPTPTPIQPAAPTVSPAQARRLGLQAVAALKRDDPARALALIAAGADVNVRDEIKDSVFLYAGAEGYAEVVEAALANGADTRVLNRYGGTALIPASEHAHLDVIRLLLASDIDVDHVNDLGWTALQEAVVLGTGGPRSQQAVRLLTAAGADPTIADRDGRGALENAERKGFTEIARILRGSRS